MPTFIRPARVEVTEGGSGALGLAAVIAAAFLALAAVVSFVLAHLLLLAAAAVVLVAGTVGTVCALRRFVVPCGASRALAAGPVATRALPRAAQPAAALPAAQHVHIHLHGLAAEDIAAAIRQHPDPVLLSIEEDHQ